MSLTRRAVAANALVAFLYLQSLAVVSVALVSEPEPEHHARQPRMEVDRRSLRAVHVGVPHVSPSVSESRSRTGGAGGLGVGAIIGIVVSSVCFAGLVVAAAVVCGCRMRKKIDPEWGLLRSFKRRNPEPVVDDEKVYAQAKGDTHLTAF